MSKTRVALIGCGAIGKTHARAFAAHNELCEIVACVDRIPATADALASQYGCAAYYDSQAMLEEIRPDAVTIGTPTNTHLPLLREIAAQGCAVLCEKPLARNIQEAREMVELVESNHLIFMNAFCHRFHGPLNQARALVQDGTLGKLICFDNRWAVYVETITKQWHSNKEAGGGGVITEEAVHSFDIFRYLVGEVAAVSAQVTTTLPVTVEDSAVLNLRSVDGVLGHVFVTWLTPPGQFGFDLYGTRGMAKVDYRATPNLSYCLHGGEWIQVPYEGPDRFVGETGHFLDCVRSGQEPMITVRDGLRTIELIEEAYRSCGVQRA